MFAAFFLLQFMVLEKRNAMDLTIITWKDRAAHQSVWALVWLALVLAGCASGRQADFDVDAQIDYCHRKVLASIWELGDDYTRHARSIPEGETAWQTYPNTTDDWCSGFWAGILWYDYGLTGDTTVLRAARGWTEALHDYAYHPLYDHDLGLIMTTSYLNGYRFMTERGGRRAADMATADRYRTVLLAAADSLCSLFNPKVGTLLSWPRHVVDYKGHNTVISTMANLELLLWADTARVFIDNAEGLELRTNDYLQIAESHADTTMEYQFRTDYSCYNLAVYDTLSGDFLYTRTQQGASDESVWARGQSWAIYGYTLMYRYTQEPRYLDFAQKVTDVYLEQLPKDMVPYWDFSRTDYRDASSACVVASALIDLADYVGGEKGQHYREAAVDMLRSLSEEPYRSGNANAAFLLHSVGNFAEGSDVDASITHADYYYIEALYKLKRLKKDGRWKMEDGRLKIEN